MHTTLVTTFSYITASLELLVMLIMSAAVRISIQQIMPFIQLEPKDSFDIYIINATINTTQICKYLKPMPIISIALSKP
jgi:hypothetical protein